MSMEISSNYKNYTNDYLERLQENKDKAKEVGKEQDETNKSESIPVPKDEYISSEKSGNRPNGLYRMGQDENGNLKIIFDTPTKAEEAESEQPKGVKLKGVSDSGRVQVTIGNMDKVKNEIKKLKEKKKQLEQQLKMAAGNEQKTKELETKLAQVEAELSVKDTDEYKKQHAEYTTEE